ncbi:MAG: DUF1292 domain-containing protein [Firmicutes bacterium]|nr:DUF1292 domain-containing protein [Bacillota bacterium]
MADQFGSDFITIMDEDGTEYELEVLSTLEYNGANYIAAIPASEELNPEVILLKSIEEDGEPILCVIEDEEELEAVNNLVMESLFQESDED